MVKKSSTYTNRLTCNIFNFKVDHEKETSAYDDEFNQLAERLNRLQADKENALAKIKTTTEEMSQARGYILFKFR